MKTITLIVSVLVVNIASATTGFDTYLSLSTSTFQCLANNGYSFFIARVGHSTGAVDTTGIQNVVNAASAGWTDVDGYIFMCPTSSCPSATQQVNNVAAALQNANAQIGTLWLDVEGSNWPSDTASNQQFVQDAITAAQNNGLSPGIYSSKNFWDTIVGSSYTGASSLPLWYARYNGVVDFSDFIPFGGWTQPNVHQYNQNVNGPCGVYMDPDYKP